MTRTSILVGAALLVVATSARAAGPTACLQRRKIAERSAPLCLAEVAGLRSWIAPADATDDRAGDPRVLVMLHGYGQSPSQVLKQVRTFARRHRCTLVFPQAPLRLAGGGRAWWPAPSTVFRPGPALHEEPVPEGMEGATEALDAFLEALTIRLGTSPRQLVVAGYSQGATLAVNVALTRARRRAAPLGGVVSLSGRFVATHPLRPQFGELRDTPLVFAHGQRDPLSPYWAAEALQQELREAGAKVAWTPNRGGHRPSTVVARRFHTDLESALSRAN